ncbi:MAG: hypothetical protein QM778_16735 [Myxococcales bacterium]
MAIWSPNAEATTGGYAVPLHEPASTTSDVAPRGRVRASTIAWFVGGASVLALGFRLSLWWLARALDPAATVDLVMDDAYYYLQIAYNLGLDGHSTFDGVSETNGYQPLWLALLAATQAVLRLDKHGLFVALQGLTSLVVGLPLLYCLKRYREPFFIALAAGMSAGYAVYPHVFSCGMETALFAPAMVAVCAAAHEGLATSARRVSFLFAGVVMIRLDAVCLLVAYALPLAYVWYKAEGVRGASLRLIKFGLPAATTLAAYMACNWFVFGEAAPISGVAKRLGAPLFSNWGILHYYLLHGSPVFVAGLVLLGIELLWSKFEGGRFVYGALGVLTVALGIHYFFFAAFTGWIPWPWYFYVFALMTVLVVMRLIGIAQSVASQSRWTKPRRAQSAALLAASLPTVFFAIYVEAMVAGQMLDNQRQGGVPSGSYNRRNIADDQRFAARGEPMVIAMGDRAGGLGYWAPSNVRVFPLEGLVASKAYLEARKHGVGEAWVREHIKPQYLIVDREALDPVRIGDQQRYVVIEPIQGRVVLDHMLSYCFPTDAVVRRQVERDDQPTAMHAPAVRTTFDLSKAETCSGPFADYVKSAVFAPESLRATGVGAEYDPKIGGDMNAAFERFDRRLAVQMRDFLGSIR